MSSHGGRPGGRPKTGGRKRGTPNRATQHLRDLCVGKNYDPAAELINIAQDPHTPLETRVQIHHDFLPYLYPKRRPVDSTHEPTTVKVVTELDISDNCSDVPDNSPSAS